MKLPLLLALLTFPCLAAEDDGDWDFLKRRIPDDKEMLTTIRNPDKTNTFRFVPAPQKFIGSAEKITVFEGMPHQTFEAPLLKK